jgi:hypothetical protein
VEVKQYGKGEEESRCIDVQELLLLSPGLGTSEAHKFLNSSGGDRHRLAILAPRLLSNCSRADAKLCAHA